MKRERQIKDVKIFITDRYGLIHFAKKKDIGQKIFQQITNSRIGFGKICKGANNIKTKVKSIIL